jgi:ABC-type uncharacterized transport system YnjBCD ATPase subunit
MRALTFTINRGDIFIIMGGRGCDKSTMTATGNPSKLLAETKDTTLRQFLTRAGRLSDRAGCGSLRWSARR